MATIMSYSSSDGTRRCDARCHQATQPECECICGGRYHGCARGRSDGPRTVVEAELMHRGLDKDALSSEEKQRISLEVVQTFGAQDGLEFMYEFHEFMEKVAAGQGLKEIASRARPRRKRTPSDPRGAIYMHPLILW